MLLGPIQMALTKDWQRNRQHLRCSYWKWVVGNCQCFTAQFGDVFSHGVLLVDSCVEKGWLKNTVWIDFLNWRFQRFLLFGNFGIFWDDIVVQHLLLFGNKLSTKGVHEKPHEEWQGSRAVGRNKVQERMNWVLRKLCESTPLKTNMSPKKWPFQ